MRPSGAGPAYRDFPMPAPLVASARSWLAGRSRPVAEPRMSSTVMLVRDAPAEPGEPGGVEVFVLLRASTMSFAPSMVAFPGGGVDPRDSDHRVPWAGPPPQRWAAQLDAPLEQARVLVIAAARELFEECGVLLAGPDEGSVVTDLSDPTWDAERAALLAREQSFGELLTRRGLVLRTDLLRLRAHWVTPECEPRRYDTRFFAALLPPGQVADDRSSEAVEARWVAPGQALADHHAGQAVMLPPTIVMMEQLAAASSAHQVLLEAPTVRRVLPEPVEHDGALWMRARVGLDGHGRG